MTVAYTFQGNQKDVERILDFKCFLEELDDVTFNAVKEATFGMTLYDAVNFLFDEITE